MITASSIELRAGSRILLDGASFRMAAGDRVGLVGRNGAGKTTLTKVLAGQAQAASGQVTSSGGIGYLPQDPRTGDLSVTGRQRILSARGLDRIVTDLRTTEQRMTSADPETLDKAMNRFARLQEEFESAGGYAAESEAASLASALGIDESRLDQSLETLSGGQRRRVELARILFSGNETLLLDEPTNHLDADSIGWLREHLRNYKGGLIIISHDVELLEVVVNRVFHLDANRCELDIYNMGWKNYLQQRETDERRRKREVQNATKKATVLLEQADKMRAKATKATAAQQMIKRAERMMAGVEGERTEDRVAKLRFPDPAPCGRTPFVPLVCRGPTAASRSSPMSTWPSTGGPRWSSWGSTVPARRRCCGCSRGSTPPTRARSSPGTVSSSATTHRSTKTSTSTGRCWRT